MTRKEMVAAIMSANGQRAIKGEFSGSLEPLLPWVLMDLQNCIYNEEIKPYPASRKLKEYRNKWAAAYKAFNHKFWRGVPDDVAAELVDLMDAAGEYLHNDVVRLRLAVRDMLRDRVSEEAARAISSAYVCQVLALIAQNLYRRVYRVYNAHHVGAPNRPENVNRYYSTENNRQITAVEYFARSWYSELGRLLGVNETMQLTKEVEALNGALARRVVSWLRMTDQEAKNENKE